MQNKTINFAIVGLGFGAEFIPIYQRHKNANMYAICQRDEKKLNEVGDAFGIKNAIPIMMSCYLTLKLTRYTLIRLFKIMRSNQ